VHFAGVDSPIPERLATDEFVLRPIVAADVALDYAAVMDSKEYLRPWEQTGWPPDARSYTESHVAPVDGDSWETVGVLVNFWVRTSRLASGVDERLLAALCAWLARDWRLGRALIVTNRQVAQQVELLERAGLRPRFTIDRPTYAAPYLAYG